MNYFNLEQGIYLKQGVHIINLITPKNNSTKYFLHKSFIIPFQYL